MRRYPIITLLVLVALLLGSALATTSRASRTAAPQETGPHTVVGGSGQSNKGRALDAGLVAHYKFDGNATDSSGNGHNGIATPGVTYVGGWEGQAAHFDAITELRVTVLDDDQLDTDYQFTLSAWVKPVQYRDTGVDDRHVLFAKWRSVGEAGDYHLTLTEGDNPGRIWFRVANTEAGFTFDELRATNSYAVPLNEWTHVAAVFDNGAMRIYRNCELAASQVSTTVLHTELGEYLHDEITIGNLWTNQTNENGFIGSIDEARLYNRPLSADEICWLARKHVLLPVVLESE
jgi:hypothetical protein